MGVKVFMICVMLTAMLLSLLYIPTKLSIPISNFRPIMSYLNVQKSAKSYPTTFAYLISASKGDGSKLKRLLLALYHPGNYYLIHMDYGAPPAEHREIAKFVATDPVFSQVGNVWVVKKPNLVTYRGPSMLATTLHAMAILLRTCKWDWFINLSASDYPLITQDDLIHAFSDLPRDLNFVQHSSRLGWKLNKRCKPIIIDPALYSFNKSQIWWVIKQRTVPTAFKLYTDDYSVSQAVQRCLRCDWWDTNGNGNNKRISIEKHCTSINMSRTWFTEDPFILASQAVQVFYLKDTKKYAKGNWHVVESVTARGYFPATQSLTNELDMSSNEEVSKNTEIVHEEVCLGGLPPIEATVQEHQQLRRDDISP